MAKLTNPSTPLFDLWPLRSESSHDIGQTGGHSLNRFSRSTLPRGCLTLQAQFGDYLSLLPTCLTGLLRVPPPLTTIKSMLPPWRPSILDVWRTKSPPRWKNYSMPHRCLAFSILTFRASIPNRSLQIYRRSINWQRNTLISLQRRR